MLSSGFGCFVIEPSLEVASDDRRRPQAVGGFAHWPVNLGLGVSGPGRGLRLGPGAPPPLSDQLDGAQKTGWNVS